MSAQFEFDRRLSDWLEEAGVPQTPAYLDELLERTRRTPQRPAWASLERWLPVQLTLPRPISAVPRFAWTFLLLALIALALIAVYLVGRPRPLPPAYGLAATGVIAFDAGNDIYVANPDGTGLHAITTGPRADIGPTFSLDGTRVAFWSEDGCQFANSGVGSTTCAGPLNLMLMSADGTNLRTIASVPEVGVDYTIAWAPDGHQLAFVRKDGLRSAILVADLDSGATHAITVATMDAGSPQWSPAGDQIAFIGGTDATKRAVYVVPAAGGQARQIAAPFDNTDIGWGGWSPDGTELAFFAAANFHNHDIYVVRPDGSGIVNLTNTPDDEFYPIWSNAGTRIAYDEIDDGKSGGSPQVNAVWVMDADGTHRTKLDTHDVTGANVSWAPDDKELFAYAADLTAVFVISVDGAHPQLSIPAPGHNYANGSFQRLALNP